jgi:para-aminobenzoate synthetase / 4-amino-4-deoxychorismate lyase
MNAAVGNASRPTRLRIALDEAGEISISAAPMEEPAKQSWLYAISARGVSSDDALLRHKTSWREMFDNELARLSRACACDEVLFTNELGQLTEGSRTNLFVQINGRLLTPPLSAGLLDGRLRNELLAQGHCTEATLYPHDLQHAEQIFLGNSLRGLIPATSVSLINDFGVTNP